MKHRVLFSTAIVLFSILFPVFVSANNTLLTASREPETPQISEEENVFRFRAESMEDESTPQTVLPAGEDDRQCSDSDITVRVKDGDTVSEMNMHDYLTGVISGEMPASFEPEALKAQAVAARTYTLYRMRVETSPSHPEADVCTDSKCCKAYQSQEALREKWGDDFEKNLQIIENAVSGTDGLYMSYENAPILAVFHSSSCGYTETSSEVWGGELPYLQSVESMENTEDVPKYEYSVTVSHKDFMSTVKESYPDICLPESPQDWFSGYEYSNSGRLHSVMLGDTEVSGTMLRALFELRSAHIDVSVTDTDVVFTTVGYGHGVGMSQYGANAMAKAGSDFKEILQWYYTDVGICRYDELTSS